jgi:hypothetical protein
LYYFCDSLRNLSSIQVVSCAALCGDSDAEKRAAAPDAQGIEAEIPQQKRRLSLFCEELERKARFPARSAGNAPKFFYVLFRVLPIYISFLMN